MLMKLRLMLDQIQAKKLITKQNQLLNA